MIPRAGEDTSEAFDLEYELQPSRTYALHPDNGIITGYVDQLAAMKQAVNKILNTERYAYIMYSWNYGIELEDLIGEEIEYILPELERRIAEALMQDERIESVDGFAYEMDGNSVEATFTVHTVYGDTEVEKEVEI